jgi:hypothetical protein
MTDFFVQEADEFTLEHWVFYNEACNSTRKSQRKFRRTVPTVHVPHSSTIYNLANKVRTTDTLKRHEAKMSVSSINIREVQQNQGLS